MLARLALLLAGGLAGGCLVPPSDDVDDRGCGDGVVQQPEQCDDGNHLDGDGCSASCGREGMVTVGWRFTDLAGTPSSCPAGFDSAQIIGFEGSSVTGRNFTFPCESGQASLLVFRAKYDVTVRIKRAGATGEVWGSSVAVPVDLTKADRAVETKLYVDAGHLRLSWGFADSAGNGISCGVDEEATVTLSHEALPGEPIVETVGCYANITRPLPAGRYTGSISARGLTKPLPTSVVIEPRGQVTPYGPVIIRLD